MKIKLSFQDAQKLIKENFISSAQEYQEFRNSDDEIKSKLPYQPMVFYKNDWKGWDDFTGTKNKELDIDIQTLQKLAVQLNLQTKAEWEEAIRNNLVGSPISINKIKGFSNWSNFLNIPEYKSFDELLVFTRTLNLKTQMDWREWCKTNERPAGIPFNLRKIYYQDFLTVTFDLEYSFWKYIFIG